MPDAGPVIADLASLAPIATARHGTSPAPARSTRWISSPASTAPSAASPKYRAAGRGLLKLMGYLQPDIREVVEMLYLQETPVILDDSKLVAKLGPVHKTPYDEGIQKTLDWMRGVM